MDYSSIAANLKSEISNLETQKQTIANTNLSSSWTGEAIASFSESLSETIISLEKEISNLNNLVTILNNVEEYKNNEQQISSLQQNLSSLPPTEANKSARNRLSSEINSITTANNTLESTIKKDIGSFSKISTTQTITNYTV